MTMTMPVTLKVQTQSATEVIDVTSRVEALLGARRRGVASST